MSHVPVLRMRKTFEEGDVLLKENEQNDGKAYHILEGTVGIHKRCGTEDVLVATAGENELVGEMALLDDAPRCATVTAISRVTVEVVDQKEILTWLAESPGRTHDLLKSLLRRLREADRQIAVKATIYST